LKSGLPPAREATVFTSQLAPAIERILFNQFRVELTANRELSIGQQRLAPFLEVDVPGTAGG
jgi:hypothetical protein